MVMRLAFASSITVHADLLIVDEALSVGDVFFQQKCYHKIRDLVKSGVTILLVSHDMRSVGEFCEEALLLDKGRVAFFGDTIQAINQYYTDFPSLLESRAHPLDRAQRIDLESDFSIWDSSVRTNP